MAKTERPAPAGTGTFAELGEDSVFGDITADNIFYKENVIGSESVENLAPHTGKFDDWDSFANFTLVNTGIAQRIASTSTAALMYNDLPKATVIDKLYTLIVKATASTIEAQDLQLAIRGQYTAGEVAQTFKMPKDVETTLRVSMPTPIVEASADTFLRASVATVTSSQTYTISEVIWRETMPIALYNAGDSIATIAKIGTDDYASMCYAMLYAANYNIEIKQAGVSSYTLEQILAAVTDDFTNNKYPMIFLNGGVNNIVLATTADEMLATMDSIIQLAKGSSSNIVLNNICYGGSHWTAPQIAKQVAFNAGLIAAYGSDPSITLVDTDTVVTSFAADGIHPDIDGQAEIFTAIDEAITVPKYINTYKYVETKDELVYTHADVLNRLARSEKSIITGSASRNVVSTVQTMLVDTTLLDSTIGLSTPLYRGLIYTIKNIGTSGNVFGLTVSGSTNNIDGAPTVPLADGVSITVQWDGTEWRAL